MRFETGENEAGRRLDRVLKKMLDGAPLSLVYRIIRKNVKVNGARVSENTLLEAGDVVEILLPDEQLVGLGAEAGTATGVRPGAAGEKPGMDTDDPGAVGENPGADAGSLGADAGADADPNPGAGQGRELPAGKKSTGRARRQFAVIYEDGNIIVVNKPHGLLTHGDAVEKKNTLTNQVIAYLVETGAWAPTGTRTFTPAPAGRLDRNTTGVVLFGKSLPAARDLAVMLSGSEGGNAYVEKAYLAVVKGELEAPLTLKARMARDSAKNITMVMPEDFGEGCVMATEVSPLSVGKGYTLVKALLLTGRTHQIRAQLAGAGFPVIGDRKYGDAAANRMALKEYGLTAQLLHAYHVKVICGAGSLEYLKGKAFRAKPPARFTEIAEDLGCDMKMKL